jgi:hypothetical protein
MAKNSLTFNQYDIPKGGYVAFDATSLRQLIVDRLNEQKVFTDQNVIGSNLAAIIDIIAYSYNTLIYYLNRTSSESMFTEAQLYENINRIVKLIDYSPIGFQTSTLSFNCSAQNLTPGVLYTIPRYTYIITNNVPFSFNEEITFLKTTNVIEDINELAQQKLLFQGLYQEYPIQTAIGEENETVVLNPGNDLVDHFNIDIFVKSVLTNKWEPFTKTNNLYLENGIAKKYEIRLNGSKKYEVKFGNNINGIKLNSGDQIAIYYLASSGEQGEVGSGALNRGQVVRYNTVQFNEILTDVFNNQYRFLQSNEMVNLLFTNTTNSTTIKQPETPDEIRQSAPANYRSQYRLITTRDYENFVKTNFANLLADVKCVNNWEYISGYLKYFYDIGLTDPLKTERALFNQIQYADSCNFNNLYLVVAPRTNSSNLNYLLPAQKELINSTLLPVKIATSETVFVDPVFKAIDFGITNTPSSFNPISEIDLTYLEIVKKTSSRKDNQSIINDITNVFTTYFDRNNIRLGQVLDLRQLTQQILSIDGVDTFYTKRTDDPSISIEGLSLFCWNPVYPENDKITTTNNISLKYFEYPYLYSFDTLPNKIRVTTVTTPFETIEY